MGVTALAVGAVVGVGVGLAGSARASGAAATESEVTVAGSDGAVGAQEMLDADVAERLMRPADLTLPELCEPVRSDDALAAGRLATQMKSNAAATPMARRERASGKR